MKAGWEYRPLGEVCKTGSGATPLKARKEYYEGGTIPWLLSGEVAQGEITEAKNFITEAGLKNSAAKLFPKNSILIAMYGATAGQVGILRFATATNQAVCAIFPSPRFVPEFLFYVFLHLKEGLIATASGNAQPNISQIKIKNTVVPIPPLEEQRRIVAVLDKAFAGIATATANAQKNLTNARALFEAYLQTAFDRGSAEWSSYKLGDQNIVRIIDGDRGSNYPSKADFQDSGHCLFLNTKNVRPNGFSFETKMFVSQEKDECLRKGKLTRGDVIMTTRGTIGNLAVYDESVEFEHIRINSGMLIFRPNIQKISPRYLFEILRSGIVKQQIAENVSGAAQPQLPIHTLVKFAIPVPDSLTAQSQIVQSLAEIEDQTNQLEKLFHTKLAALTELKQSLLQKAFAGELT